MVAHTFRPPALILIPADTVTVLIASTNLLAGTILKLEFSIPLAAKRPKVAFLCVLPLQRDHLWTVMAQRHKARHLPSLALSSLLQCSNFPGAVQRLTKSTKVVPSLPSVEAYFKPHQPSQSATRIINSSSNSNPSSMSLSPRRLLQRVFPVARILQ